MNCTSSTLDDLIEYSYDAAGNRGGGSYGTGNRITGFSPCGYSTTHDGSVAGRTSCAEYASNLEFKWTAEGNFPMAVTRIATPDTFRYTFYANPAGRLARMDANGAAYRHFLWSGDHLFAELDASGNILTEYSWYPGMDRLHQFKVGSDLYNGHTDAAGNVIALSRSTSVYRAYQYTAWGDSAGGWDAAGLGDKDRARFKGALAFPELGGIYYMRNRWYDTWAGRFLSEDPLGLAGSVNRYVFAAGNPVDLRDPSGAVADDDSDQLECPIESATCSRGYRGGVLANWDAFLGWGSWARRAQTQSHVWWGLVAGFRQALWDLERRTGTTLGLSNGLRDGACSRRVRTFHTCGTAADIALINGKEIDDPNVWELVWKVQGEALNIPGAAEVFGPAGLYKSYTWPNPLARLWYSELSRSPLWENHQDHIHVAVHPEQYGGKRAP